MQLFHAKPSRCKQLRDFCPPYNMSFFLHNFAILRLIFCKILQYLCVAFQKIYMLRWVHNFFKECTVVHPIHIHKFTMNLNSLSHIQLKHFDEGKHLFWSKHLFLYTPFGCRSACAQMYLLQFGLQKPLNTWWVLHWGQSFLLMLCPLDTFYPLSYWFKLWDILPLVGKACIHCLLKVIDVPFSEMSPLEHKLCRSKSTAIGSLTLSLI